MKHSLFEYFSPFSKLVFAVFAVISVFFIVSFIGILIAVPFFGISLTNLEQTLNFENANNISLLKYIQIIQSIGLFIIPSLILGFLFYHKNPDIFGLRLNKSPISISLVLIVLVMLFGLPVINFSAEINSYLKLPEWLSPVENWMKATEENAQHLTEVFLNVNSFEGMLLNLFMIAVIPAIGEEFLFRGIIQRVFIDWTKNQHIGIFIGAFLFSALHLQFYGFLPRLLMGLLFGYAIVWSKTIWLPIAAHFTNNAAAVILYFIYNEETVSQEIDTIGTSGTPVTYLLLSMVLAGGLIYIIYLTEKEKSNSEINLT